MLIGIAPFISPELLALLHRMGHGDTLVLADAHFPAYSVNEQVLRADGVQVDTLLEGILPLISLDDFISTPLIMMAPVADDSADPCVEDRYRQVVDRYWPNTPAIHYIDRFAFYEQAKQAVAVVLTNETVKYGNLIITKGVTPV